MMRHSVRTWGVAAAAVLALSGVPAAIVTIAPSGEANADVCASAGRRVTVSGCASLSDVMAPYVPPPAYYAPLPEDYPPPPPPPPPAVSGCVGWNGRWVNAGACN
ncbi:hypothetical protein [Mycobacterium sp. shizuoka-1]|uniref:hypothetical protein n=1 Tax=Mycobacterium sp. shizuoka-1 TaxID=2039281 RepID=UPI000C063968|nr:hypothetical protein [Mycobacterium sp. shizuoka-1]GAY15475.1 hypothetical protein MSZK_22010 [Mycobacterium sp. shizuoka-1]